MTAKYKCIPDFLQILLASTRGGKHESFVGGKLGLICCQLKSWRWLRVQGVKGLLWLITAEGWERCRRKDSIPALCLPALIFCRRCGPFSSRGFPLKFSFFYFSYWIFHFQLHFSLDFLRSFYLFIELKCHIPYCLHYFSQPFVCIVCDSIQFIPVYLDVCDLFKSPELCVLLWFEHYTRYKSMKTPHNIPW